MGSRKRVRGLGDPLRRKDWPAGWGQTTLLEEVMGLEWVPLDKPPGTPMGPSKEGAGLGGQILGRGVGEPAGSEAHTRCPGSRGRRPSAEWQTVPYAWE